MRKINRIYSKNNKAEISILYLLSLAFDIRQCQKEEMRNMKLFFFIFIILKNCIPNLVFIGSKYHLQVQEGNMQLSQPPTRQVSLVSLFDCLLLGFSHLSYAFKREVALYLLTIFPSLSTALLSC